MSIWRQTRRSRISGSCPPAGGEARRLNQTPNPEERPRFSPDGKRLIWTSKATDPTQIWMSNFTPESGGLDGQPHQVTNISTGADGAIWSPDGKNIVFLSSVYPDAKDDAENKKRDEELGKSKVKAKIFTKLLYRHWTSYTEHKRSHLFAVSADVDASQPNSARDLTPGDHDVPPFNLGGQDMYAVSPDGQEVAYTSNIDEVEATSTNNEIFLVPMAGGRPRKISTSPGNDNTPVYSPDGNHIAWRSMARAGFEADKESLHYLPAKGWPEPERDDQFRSLGRQPGVDARFEGDLFYGGGSRRSADLGRMDGWQTTEASRAASCRRSRFLQGRELAFFQSASRSARRARSRGSMSRTRPKSANLTPISVTHMNDALLSQIDMQPMESFTFRARTTSRSRDS